MKKLYAIVDAALTHGVESTPIPYLLLFEDNGVYSFETRITDKNFFKKYQNVYLNLQGTTEKGLKFEAARLYISSYKSTTGSTTIICNGFIRVVESREYFGEQKTMSESEGQRVFAIELEGFKIQFSDHTVFERYRYGGKLNDLLNLKFDHTQCTLCVHDQPFHKYFNIRFSAIEGNDNILVEFFKTSVSILLFEKDYGKFRDDFLHFLSFINGAPVAIRKEYMGNFQTISQEQEIGAEITNTYSFKTLENHQFNDYVPINYEHGTTSDILPILALKGFEHYGIHNQTLDLNALVESLNQANQTTGAKERYYILITALERIASNFNNAPNKPKTLLDEQYFSDVLKEDILQLLIKHKSAIKKHNRAAFDILKSRIGTLNRLTNNDTKVKLYRFFEFCKIQTSPYIHHLIEVERNEAVHEGNVGKTHEEALTAYLKLDHLLRDVILNLMEYDRLRKPRVTYG